MVEQDPIKGLVKHVGRGKTLARDLSPAQAEDAMGRMLRGEFSPAQLGAFLQALRIKETTATELQYAALGCRSFLDASVAPAQPGADRSPVVINLAFDTARKGGVVSLLAGALLKTSGLAEPLVVWEPAINFPANDSLGRTLAVMDRHPSFAAGVPMVTIQQMLPAWRNLREIRSQIGFRSILNTLEKLLRPWEEVPVVVGISHDTFSERLCHVLAKLGAPRGAVVQGNHGTCDLNLGEKPTETTVWEGDAVADLPVGVDAEAWGTGGAVHLVGSLGQWPEQIQDARSPLWGAVRAQAGYLLSVARGISFQGAQQLISDHPSIPQGARP